METDKQPPNEFDRISNTIVSTDWPKRPAANPRYRGKTPEDIARALLRPTNPEAEQKINEQQQRK